MLDPVLAALYVTLAASLLIPLVSSREEATPRVAITLSLAGVAAFTVGMLMLLLDASKAPVVYYGGLVLHDGFSSLVSLGAGIVGLITLLAASREPSLWTTHPAYYSLLPLALFGVFFLAGATDALVVLAAWLLVSVISYVMIALPDDLDSARAATRYIYMGALATLFIGLWIAGQAVAAADVGLDALSLAPATKSSVSGLALAFLLAGLGFKLGLVPFHWWLPSVYGRADGRAVAAVAGVVKMGFIALIARIVYQAAQQPFGFEILSGYSLLATVLAVGAVATMTYGNIAALGPRNIQAVLAYSSIAHVGYILAGLAALAWIRVEKPELVNLALAGVALQTIAYGLAKAPLFSLTAEAGRSLDDWRGLSTVDNAGVYASILLLSLLGLPPLLGFWGKLYLFIAVASYSIPLLVIALVNSGVSSFYYVRIVREALQKEEKDLLLTNELKASLVVAALLTILLGLVAPLLIQLV